MSQASGNAPYEPAPTETAQPQTTQLVQQELVRNDGGPLPPPASPRGWRQVFQGLACLEEQTNGDNASRNSSLGGVGVFTEGRSLRSYGSSWGSGGGTARAEHGLPGNAGTEAMQHPPYYGFRTFNPDRRSTAPPSNDLALLSARGDRPYTTRSILPDSSHGSLPGTARTTTLVNTGRYSILDADLSSLTSTVRSSLPCGDQSSILRDYAPGSSAFDTSRTTLPDTGRLSMPEAAQSTVLNSDRSLALDSARYGMQESNLSSAPSTVRSSMPNIGPVSMPGTGRGSVPNTVRSKTTDADTYSLPGYSEAGGVPGTGHSSLPGESRYGMPSCGQASLSNTGRSNALGTGRTGVHEGAPGALPHTDRSSMSDHSHVNVPYNGRSFVHDASRYGMRGTTHSHTHGGALPHTGRSSLLDSIRYSMHDLGQGPGGGQVSSLPNTGRSCSTSTGLSASRSSYAAEQSESLLPLDAEPQQSAPPLFHRRGLADLSRLLVPPWQRQVRAALGASADLSTMERRQQEQQSWGRHTGNPLFASRSRSSGSGPVSVLATADARLDAVNNSGGGSSCSGTKRRRRASDTAMEAVWTSADSAPPSAAAEAAPLQSDTAQVERHLHSSSQEPLRPEPEASPRPGSLASPRPGGASPRLSARDDVSTPRGAAGDIVPRPVLEASEAAETADTTSALPAAGGDTPPVGCSGVACSSLERGRPAALVIQSPASDEAGPWLSVGALTLGDPTAAASASEAVNCDDAPSAKRRATGPQLSRGNSAGSSAVAAAAEVPTPAAAATAQPPPAAAAAEGSASASQRSEADGSSAGGANGGSKGLAEALFRAALSEGDDSSDNLQLAVLVPQRVAKAVLAHSLGLVAAVGGSSTGSGGGGTAPRSDTGTTLERRDAACSPVVYTTSPPGAPAPLVADSDPVSTVRHAAAAAVLVVADTTGSQDWNQDQGGQSPQKPVGAITGGDSPLGGRRAAAGGAGGRAEVATGLALQLLAANLTSRLCATQDFCCCCRLSFGRSGSTLAQHSAEVATLQAQIDALSLLVETAVQPTAGGAGGKTQGPLGRRAEQKTPHVGSSVAAAREGVGVSSTAVASTAVLRALCEALMAAVSSWRHWQHGTEKPCLLAVALSRLAAALAGWARGNGGVEVETELQLCAAWLLSWAEQPRGEEGVLPGAPLMPGGGEEHFLAPSTADPAEEAAAPGSGFQTAKDAITSDRSTTAYDSIRHGARSYRSYGGLKTVVEVGTPSGFGPAASGRSRSEVGSELLQSSTGRMQPTFCVVRVRYDGEAEVGASPAIEYRQSVLGPYTGVVGISLDAGPKPRSPAAPPATECMNQGALHGGSSHALDLLSGKSSISGRSSVSAPSVLKTTATTAGCTGGVQLEAANGTGMAVEVELEPSEHVGALAVAPLMTEAALEVPPADAVGEMAPVTVAAPAAAAEDCFSVELEGPAGSLPAQAAELAANPEGLFPASSLGGGTKASLAASWRAPRSASGLLLSSSAGGGMQWCPPAREHGPQLDAVQAAMPEIVTEVEDVGGDPYTSPPAAQQQNPPPTPQVVGDLDEAGRLLGAARALMASAGLPCSIAMLLAAAPGTFAVLAVGSVSGGGTMGAGLGSPPPAVEIVRAADDAGLEAERRSRADDLLCEAVRTSQQALHTLISSDKVTVVDLVAAGSRRELAALRVGADGGEVFQDPLCTAAYGTAAHLAATAVELLVRATMLRCLLALAGVASSKDGGVAAVAVAVAQEASRVEGLLRAAMGSDNNNADSNMASGPSVRTSHAVSTAEPRNPGEDPEQSMGHGNSSLGSNTAGCDGGSGMLESLSAVLIANARWQEQLPGLLAEAVALQGAGREARGLLYGAIQLYDKALYCCQPVAGGPGPPMALRVLRTAIAAARARCAVRLASLIPFAAASTALPLPSSTSSPASSASRRLSGSASTVSASADAVPTDPWVLPLTIPWYTLARNIHPPPNDGSSPSPSLPRGGTSRPAPNSPTTLTDADAKSGPPPPPSTSAPPDPRVATAAAAALIRLTSEFRGVCEAMAGVAGSSPPVATNSPAVDATAASALAGQHHPGGAVATAPAEAATAAAGAPHLRVLLDVGLEGARAEALAPLAEVALTLVRLRLLAAAPPSPATPSVSSPLRGCLRDRSRLLHEATALATCAMRWLQEAAAAAGARANPASVSSQEQHPSMQHGGEAAGWRLRAFPGGGSGCSSIGLAAAEAEAALLAAVAVAATAPLRVITGHGDFSLQGNGAALDPPGPRPAESARQDRPGRPLPAAALSSGDEECEEEDDKRAMAALEVAAPYDESWEKAWEWGKAALRSRQELYGPDSDPALEVQAFLGYVAGAGMGLWHVAEPLLVSVVSLRGERLGLAHPSTQAAACCYVHLLVTHNRLRTAENFLHRMLPRSAIEQPLPQQPHHLRWLQQRAQGGRSAAGTRQEPPSSLPLPLAALKRMLDAIKARTRAEHSAANKQQQQRTTRHPQVLSPPASEQEADRQQQQQPPGLPLTNPNPTTNPTLTIQYGAEHVVPAAAVMVAAGGPEAQAPAAPGSPGAVAPPRGEDSAEGQFPTRAVPQAVSQGLLRQATVRAARPLGPMPLPTPPPPPRAADGITAEPRAAEAGARETAEPAMPPAKLQTPPPTGSDQQPMQAAPEPVPPPPPPFPEKTIALQDPAPPSAASCSPLPLLASVQALLLAPEEPEQQQPDEEGKEELQAQCRAVAPPVAPLSAPPAVVQRQEDELVDQQPKEPLPASLASARTAKEQIAAAASDNNNNAAAPSPSERGPAPGCDEAVAQPTKTRPAASAAAEAAGQGPSGPLPPAYGSRTKPMLTLTVPVLLAGDEEVASPSGSDPLSVDFLLSPTESVASPIEPVPVPMDSDGSPSLERSPSPSDPLPDPGSEALGKPLLADPMDPEGPFHHTDHPDALESKDAMPPHHQHQHQMTLLPSILEALTAAAAAVVAPAIAAAVSSPPTHDLLPCMMDPLPTALLSPAAAPASVAPDSPAMSWTSISTNPAQLYNYLLSARASGAGGAGRPAHLRTASGSAGAARTHSGRLRVGTTSASAGEGDLERFRQRLWNTEGGAASPASETAAAAAAGRLMPPEWVRFRATGPAAPVASMAAAAAVGVAHSAAWEASNSWRRNMEPRQSLSGGGRSSRARNGAPSHSTAWEVGQPYGPGHGPGYGHGIGQGGLQEMTGLPPPPSSGRSNGGLPPLYNGSASARGPPSARTHGSSSLRRSTVDTFGSGVAGAGGSQSARSASSGYGSGHSARSAGGAGIGGGMYSARSDGGSNGRRSSGAGMAPVRPGIEADALGRRSFSGSLQGDEARRTHWGWSAEDDGAVAGGYMGLAAEAESFRAQQGRWAEGLMTARSVADSVNAGTEAGTGLEAVEGFKAAVRGALAAAPVVGASWQGAAAAAAAEREAGWSHAVAQLPQQAEDAGQIGRGSGQDGEMVGLYGSTVVVHATRGAGPRSSPALGVARPPPTGRGPGAGGGGGGGSRREGRGKSGGRLATSRF